MHRRSFLVSTTLATLALPLGAEAQTAPKVPKVAYLSPGSASDPRRALLFRALQQGLSDLGYVNGKNLIIEARFAEGNYDRLPELAAELVRLKPDVIVAYATPAVQAAQHATATVPIVMAAVIDPVASGLVEGLGRPGGNATGLSLMAPELLGKQMQLLKELVPKVSRVAALWNPTNAGNAPQLREAEAAARKLRVRLQAVEATDPSTLDSAFAAISKQGTGAIIVLVDAMFVDNRTRIVRLVEATRMPAVYGLREYAEAGGLMFYGANPVELNRRAAIFVDKILRGAKAGDLPVEQATKFELVINLKTAKTLGLTIPQSLLLRADEVLQ